MQTILFARVSSREQEETGYSLPSQEKLLKEYADKKGFEVAKKFSISESASGHKQRNTFNEMLSYIKKSNIKIVVCEKVDRLTRNLKDAVCINEWINSNPEREVHFVKESCVLNKSSKSNEKFIWNIKVSVAQYYIDNLSEEVKKGQIEKIRQGWLPTKPPMGYKTIGEKGHKIHIVDEEKASFLKKMFEFYATGNYSLKKLTQKMAEIGFRTRGGNKISKGRLAKIISDPFYYGKIRWNNKIYQGKQEPLISGELFNRVQQILKSKTTPKYRKHFYLFKGLIGCAECNGRITWEKQKGFIYGHCNHYRNCSQKIWAKEPEVEKQVLKVFGKLQIKSPGLVDWIRNALKEGHKDETEYHTTALSELKQRYERMQKRLDSLYDDKLDEKIDKDFYEKKFKQYSEEKESVLEAIKKHSQSNSKYFELGMNIYELSQKAPEIYQKATTEEKRQLLGLVFDTLSLREEKLSFVYSKPFEILAEAVKETNSSKVLDLAKSQPEIFEQPFLTQKQAFSPAFDTLLRVADDVRTYFKTTKDYFYIPKLVSP